MVGDGGEEAENIGGLTDGFNFVAFNDDCSISEDSRLRIHGYDHGVVEDSDDRLCVAHLLH